MAMQSSRQPEFSIVFFDLEATGLSVTDEITQIGAKCGYRTYSKYVIPKVPIPNNITSLTGISKTGEQMYHHGKPVEAVSPNEAIVGFISFLQSIGGKIILVAHNCFNSDGPMLAGLADKQRMIPKLKKIVVGFADSLALLKKSLPADRSTGKGYKLGELAEEFLGSSEGLHDALGDATMLEKLMMLQKIPVTVDDIIDSREIFGAMTHKYKCRLESYNQSQRNDDYYHDYDYPDSS